MLAENKTINFNCAFDENLFQQYVELFLDSYNKRANHLTIISIFGLSLFGLFFAGFIAVPEFRESQDIKTVLAFIGCLIVAACSFIGSIVGARIQSGYHHPKWNNFRWKARSQIAFYRLQKDDTKNPLCVGLPAVYQPMDIWPLPLKKFDLAILTFLFSYFVFNKDYDKCLYFFDTIPGILPRFKNVPKDVKLSVQFSGTFYFNFIEKGSHGDVFANSYSDIQDVVEDQEKYPGLAIIRHKDGYSELVVFTDKLEGGTWDEVKLRIFKSCPDAFPDKEIARLTALQNDLGKKKGGDDIW